MAGMIFFCQNLNFYRDISPKLQLRFKYLKIVFFDTNSTTKPSFVQIEMVGLSCSICLFIVISTTIITFVRNLFGKLTSAAYVSYSFWYFTDLGFKINVAIVLENVWIKFY